VERGATTESRERGTEDARGPSLRELLGEPHLVEPALGYAVWWTEPHGVIGAMLGPSRIDASLADYVTGPLHDAMRERASGAPTYALHDWSHAIAYDGTTRLRMVRWVVAHRAELAVIGVVQPPGASILRMAARVGEGLLAESGVHFSLVESAAEFVLLHRLARAR
jgi:hypothetical protein